MLSDAIDDHQKFRDRLMKYIKREPTNALDLFAMTKDSNCELGWWLSKHRTKPIALTPEYQALQEIHHEFHLELGKTMKLGMENKQEEALALLNGSYAVLESRLTEALLNLGDVE